MPSSPGAAQSLFREPQASQDPPHQRSSAVLCVREPWNYVGWKRPLKSSCPTVMPAQPSPPLNNVLQSHIYTSSKKSQGWWPHHFPGKPVPVVDHSEGIAPDIQPKLPPLQSGAISSQPGDVLQSLLPVFCSPVLLGCALGSTASVSVLMNVLGSVRSMFQGQENFEKIFAHSKGPKKFTGALHCFHFFTPGGST